MGPLCHVGSRIDSQVNEGRIAYHSGSVLMCQELEALGSHSGDWPKWVSIWLEQKPRKKKQARLIPSYGVS